MARTFTPITGGGAGGAYQTGDRLGYQTVEKVRQALDMALYLPIIDLGGDERGISTASFVAVNAARQISIKGDNLGGLTLDVVLHYYTSNAATSVQMKVRNLTDSTDAATGTISTSTTVVTETVTVTLASATKTYQLQIDGGNADNPIYGWGYFRFRTVPA
jgi:hypothetical protein